MGKFVYECTSLMLSSVNLQELAGNVDLISLQVRRIKGVSFYRAIFLALFQDISFLIYIDLWHSKYLAQQE